MGFNSLQGCLQKQNVRVRLSRVCEAEAALLKHLTSVDPIQAKTYYKERKMN